MKGLQCIETVEAHNPVLWPNKHIQIDWISSRDPEWNRLSLIHMKKKKKRFQKRREFLFMCWLNKVQVNDMEKQFWKSSIYQHYCIRDVMRLYQSMGCHITSLYLQAYMFNNHICSYERKYCCSIKPLKS